jgi:hypothetical protein
MRFANILQLLAIITLFTLTNVEYQQSKNAIVRELKYLRVQKSFQNRQSFEEEYGSNWKQVIKDKIEENKQLLNSVWDVAMTKIAVCCVMLLVSLIHIIRYFYIYYDDEDTNSEISLRYDLFTWTLNASFFSITAGWAYYFNQSNSLVAIAYLLALGSITIALDFVTKYLWNKQQSTFSGLRFFQYTLAILLYFQLMSIPILAGIIASPYLKPH